MKLRLLILQPSMGNFRAGNLVRYIGCTQDQINWGSNDDPRGILIEGDKYYVESVDVRSHHTKLTLRGISGRFNSVCFENL
jgi:hypothetical protein